MSHHLVAAQDVHFTYPDGTPVLHGVDFRITHGECVGIVGANGSGKSTLVNHLNGFLLPQKGRIVIGDEAVTAKNRQEIRRRIGLVFQDPDDQLILGTVAEDVAFGPRNLGLPEDVVQARVAQALDQVGAAGIAQKAPHHLSDGQKRIVAIAGVLALEPDILVMDEPTSNLDPRHRRNLIELIRRFQHTRILVSHDLDFLWDTCSRVLVLESGRVRADGPAQTILSQRELLESAGLELPLRLQG